MKRLKSWGKRIANLLTKMDHSDWVSLIGSIGGAFIAAIVALFVVRYQNNLEMAKDAKKENDTELSKLKYLHFLLNDTYRVIDFYDRTTQSLTSSFQNNPFTISNFPSYPAHSLDAIANKINQEEYYLAAVNQLKSDEVAELLLACNTLHNIYNGALEHYRKELPGLMKDKDSLRSNLDILIERINQYLINTDKSRFSSDEEIIYNDINKLMGEVKTSQKNFSDSNDLLFQSETLLMDPLIKILDPRGQIRHRELMLEAYYVFRPKWLFSTFGESG